MPIFIRYSQDLSALARHRPHSNIVRIMHGTQLGWAWPIVIALTGVGVIFAFVRSRTETVLAVTSCTLAITPRSRFFFSSHISPPSTANFHLNFSDAAFPSHHSLQ